VIYVDTSVVLAYLLAEDRQPPDSLWDDVLVSSRLVEYETWTRVNSRKLAEPYFDAARVLLGRLAMVELSPLVLARALEPFPGPSSIRTLDALHLATCVHLREHSTNIELASYDHRMNNVARELGIPLYFFPRA